MALVEGDKTEAMKPIESPAELFDHLHRIGVHLSIERIWWQAEDRNLLRVRDPMWALDQHLRFAMKLWEPELYARVSEMTGSSGPLPATWQRGLWRGVVDIPISAEDSEVKQLRILNIAMGLLE